MPIALVIVVCALAQDTDPPPDAPPLEERVERLERLVMERADDISEVKELSEQLLELAAERAGVPMEEAKARAEYASEECADTEEPMDTGDAPEEDEEVESGDPHG